MLTSRFHALAAALAIAAVLAVAGCAGADTLKVGDCTDYALAPSPSGSDPQKVDCTDPAAKSKVTKVAPGEGRSGSCEFSETSYDDPTEAGKYVCLGPK